MSTLVPTISTRRLGGLTRANVRLLTRNSLTLVYALVFPLIPLALLAFGDASDSVSLTSVSSVVLLAMLFPVYYNTLSQVVTRRDELVLKRLRTGEARDAEILLSMALPGFAIALVLAAVTLPLGALFGMSWPVNPVMYAVAILLMTAMFTAFAFWTAAWTKNAEAAQLTSTPVILLATAGSLAPMFPERVQDLLGYTPGGAMTDLLSAVWFTDASFTGSWADALQPLLVIVAWTVLALGLAQRSMRWEPRA